MVCWQQLQMRKMHKHAIITPAILHSAIHFVMICAMCSMSMSYVLGAWGDLRMLVPAGADGAAGAELEDSMEPGPIEGKPDDSLVLVPSDRGTAVGAGGVRAGGGGSLVQQPGAPWKLNLCQQTSNGVQQLSSRMQQLPEYQPSRQLQAQGKSFVPGAHDAKQQQQYLPNFSNGVSSTSSSSTSSTTSSSSPTTYSRPGLLSLVRLLLHSYASGALVSSGLGSAE